MIPKIIHQTAPTKRLTWEEERLAKRLRRMLPDWQYRLWDDDDTSRMMARFYPHYADRFERIPFGVAKADVARYAFMALHGGFYFDTDYKLLKPIDAAMLAAACVLPLEGVRPHSGTPRLEHLEIGNSVFGSASGHPFWNGLIGFIFDEKRPEAMTEPGQIIPRTGPSALTEYYARHHADYPDVVLPAKNLFQPSIHLLALRSSADESTYGIHLHWGSWRGRSPGVAARTLVRRKLNALLS